MPIRNLEARSFVIVVVVVTAAFLWIVQDLLMPVFWAAVLAVLFQPVNRRILPRVKHRSSVSALLTTLFVIVVILVPFGLLGAAVAQQALGLYRRIAEGDVDLQAPIDFVERQLPMVNEMLEAYGVDVEAIRTSIENAALTASQYVATEAVAFGRNTLTFALMFGVMLYVLFFFIRDWERILDGVVRALPLGDERERRLMSKFAEVSRATIKGTLVVAVVQGLLGGITFAIVGIEASILWGVAMGLVSLIPAVGPPIVWIPAAVIMIATGSIWEGVVIIVVGTFVIGLVDNLLRPILVGRDTRMPDYLVLISTLGGLAVFGIAGVVAGPLIAGLFLVVWDMFAEEYADAPPRESKPAARLPKFPKKAPQEPQNSSTPSKAPSQDPKDAGAEAG